MGSPLDRRHRSPLRRVVLAGAVALGVALVLRLELWRCPVAELLGVPCPGCGLTRAAWALVSGDIAGAVQIHPLSPVIVPLLAGTAVQWLIGRGSEMKPPTPRGSSSSLAARSAPRARGALCALLAVLLVGVWASRFLGAFGGPVPVASHLLG